MFWPPNVCETPFPSIGWMIWVREVFLSVRFCPAGGWFGRVDGSPRGVFPSDRMLLSAAHGRAHDSGNSLILAYAPWYGEDLSYGLESLLGV